MLDNFLLQIERDTNGLLQCHPCPGEFSDKSKRFHHSYFMGLQRKQGSNPQEGKSFDIRMTVEEFKHDVYAYSFWKPTMWIHVCHVKRNDIPEFVFPSGVRPSHPAKSAAESRSVKRSLACNSPQIDSVMSRKKLKQDEVCSGFGSSADSSSTAMSRYGATSLDSTMANKQLEPECTSSNGTEIAGFGKNGSPSGIPSSSGESFLLLLVTKVLRKCMMGL